jgi:isopentenyldiphosphate isomerase
MIHVVMLWMVNEDGELLLARRADSKAQDAGLWGPSVTGKLEHGETFEQALARETEEELALKPSEYLPEYLFETDFDYPDGEARQFKIFMTRVPGDIIGKLKLDQDEVAEVQWMTRGKISRLLKSKPGEIVVASAFVLWERIFEALERQDAMRASTSV